MSDSFLIFLRHTYCYVAHCQLGKHEIHFLASGNGENRVKICRLLLGWEDKYNSSDCFNHEHTELGWDLNGLVTTLILISIQPHSTYASLMCMSNIT